MSRNKQILVVSDFQKLTSTPFRGDTNAICWKRQLFGNFSEIVEKVKFEGSMVELTEKQLLKLQLTNDGETARQLLLQDLQRLKTIGAMPILNIIESYERDTDFSFFPTDVYSFHVDRSPVPTDTYLCTYFGAPSDIVANSEVEQKIKIPEIRSELKKLYSRSDSRSETGSESGFEEFLTDYFFDLHYQMKPSAKPLSLGLGNLWRLAIDHPQSEVLPCVHRAPEENSDERRLMLIC